MYADGTHGSGGMSFDTFSRDKVAEVGDILYRNETERITLRELLEVVYYAKQSKLYNWDGRTLLVPLWTEAEGNHFVQYDAVTKELLDYYPKADLFVEKGYHRRLANNEVALLDISNSRFYRWDVVEDRVQLVLEYSPSYDGSIQHRVREDGSLIIAGLYSGSNQGWVYIERTGELLTYDRIRVPENTFALSLGTHSVLVIDYPKGGPRCYDFDFSDALRK